MQPFHEKRSGAVSAWPIALSLCVATSFSIAAGVMLLDLRHGALKNAQDAAQNLVHVIEQDVSRNIELMDLSLMGVVEGLARDDVKSTPSAIRQLVLFDRAAAAKNLGALVVFDREGELHIDAAGNPPRKIARVTDRDYFQAQVEHDAGLFVSAPYVSRLLGTDVLGLSRRVNDADGGFDGVALATIKLSYFTDLFRGLQVGQRGVISLVRTDGVLLARKPSLAGDPGRNLASAPAFKRMIEVGNGTFIAESGIDGTERFYAVRRVADLPLMVSVGLATQDIYAEWRTKALALGLIVLFACLATVGLTWVLMRELGRRGSIELQLLSANAELAKLSTTDALTGLENRRKFDDILARETGRSQRSRKPLTLIILDADLFKQFNDTYGHQEGDTVLKAIGQCLRERTSRSGDVACRIGGEEFAVILPDTGAAGGLAVAERIRRDVVRLSIPHVHSKVGVVSISMGVASLQDPREDATSLFARADAALYEAKRMGRNRIATAQEPMRDGRAA